MLRPIIVWYIVAVGYNFTIFTNTSVSSAHSISPSVQCVCIISSCNQLVNLFFVPFIPSFRLHFQWLKYTPDSQQCQSFFCWNNLIDLFKLSEQVWDNIFSWIIVNTEIIASPIISPQKSEYLASQKRLSRLKNPIISPLKNDYLLRFVWLCAWLCHNAGPIMT